MKMTFQEALELLNDRISRNLGKKPLVIAIDGRSASGKTTFASELSKRSGATVIHTDDFFRPRDEYGNLNISDHDGNFDVERFKREVVSGIASNRPFEYGIFDCRIGSVVKAVLCTNASCIVVEGVYSLNPKLGNYADIKVFFDITPEHQKSRIIARNGVEGFRNFDSVWIPAEERYFSHYNVENFCDIKVDN